MKGSSAGKSAAVRGILALLVAGCAVGLTATGAAASRTAASGAGGSQAPVVLQYTCDFPVVGYQPLTATFAWPDGLREATVGTSTPSLPVEVTATVAPGIRTLVSFASVASVEGTADASADVSAPQGDLSEGVKLAVPRTSVSPGSGPLTVPASGLIPSVLLSQAGQAKVVAGAFVLHLATLTASGASSFLGNISVSCTLDSGQTGVISSLSILSPASPAAVAPSATRAAPRPAPARSRVPAPVRSRAPGPAPSASPRPQSLPGRLLGYSAPLARSFPGFLLLALFLLCAAVLVIVRAGCRIVGIGLAAGGGSPPAGRPPSKRSPPKHRIKRP